MGVLRYLGDWTGPRIAEQCRDEYSRYRAARTEGYRAYFTANAELKAADHAYKASNLATALPNGWGKLSDALPEKERHRHHLSGGSSQVLALALLGVSAARDQSHAWLWEGLGPLPPPSGPVPHAQFEYTVDAELLNEHPRQTAVDYFVDDPAALVCVECKWMEAGMGGCSCGSDAALVGDCSDRVLDALLGCGAGCVRPIRPRTRQAVPAQLHVSGGA